VAALLPLGVVSSATAQVYEPNDSFITGFGPVMAGTTYFAGTETDNDEDHYFFYVPQRTQMFFNLTVNQGTYLCADVRRQTHEGYSYVDFSGISVNVSQTQTAAVTLDRGKYFFVVDAECADAGDAYSFNISPPGTTSTYEPFAAACNAAHAPVLAATQQLTVAKTALTKAKRKLAKARARGAKRAKLRRLKVKVQGAKSAVKAANVGFKGAVAAEGSACSVPM
jgi:hypothetical protein